LIVFNTNTTTTPLTTRIEEATREAALDDPQGVKDLNLCRDGPFPNKESVELNAQLHRIYHNAMLMIDEIYAKYINNYFGTISSDYSSMFSKTIERYRDYSDMHKSAALNMQRRLQTLNDPSLSKKREATPELDNELPREDVKRRVEELQRKFEEFGVPHSNLLLLKLEELNDQFLRNGDTRGPTILLPYLIAERNRLAKLNVYIFNESSTETPLQARAANPSHTVSNQLVDLLIKTKNYNTCYNCYVFIIHYLIDYIVYHIGNCIFIGYLLCLLYSNIKYPIY
jgi:hypothetical protein